VIGIMKTTMIGHAGLLIETSNKIIVCDPWLSKTGAFLCSWHQWPRNDNLGDEIMNKIMKADYLYVSHLHRDHFDEEFLTGYFKTNPDVTVLLPKFSEPNILKRELSKLGCTKFIEMVDKEPIDMGGFTIHGVIDWNGTYANKGDSTLCVTDESGTIVNQNDSKIDWYPESVDIHFTQFSGAIWYPMAYRSSMNDEDKYHDIIKSEIERRASTFINTITESKALHVFPHAGPPVFLRESQQWLNAVGESVFYDQPELLSYVRSHDVNNVHPVMPGMVLELNNHELTIAYPEGMTAQDVEDYYALDNKAKELEKYAMERKSIIEAFDNSLPQPTVDLGQKLQEWLTPVLEAKAELLDKIGSNIMVESDDKEVQILFDWQARKVRTLNSTDVYDHSFTIPRRILELMLIQKQRVWTSEIFLGAVHTSWRRDAYNRYVYDLLAQMAVPPLPKQ